MMSIILFGTGFVLIWLASITSRKKQIDDSAQVSQNGPAIANAGEDITIALPTDSISLKPWFVSTRTMHGKIIFWRAGLPGFDISVSVPWPTMNETSLSARKCINTNELFQSRTCIRPASFSREAFYFKMASLVISGA